jgi:hypothetical protein
VADRQVKVVGKHIKDCFAVKNVRKGIWNTQWGPIAYGKHGAPVVTTERRYGKKGVAFKYWVRFICNCGGCPAELHVESDFILAAAKRASASTTRRSG